MKVLVVFICCGVALGQEFGSDGSSGHHGPNGYDGRSGQSVTIFAEGQNETLHLYGEPGTDGRNGEPGQQALGCVQPMNVPYNLEGADGGRGGDGGSGGVGGHGGGVTVYYTDLANLRRVFVRATPGRGGIGGYGAYGGQACYCSVPQWTVTTASGSQTYRCSNGTNGYNGSRGSNGSSGQYGNVMLINSPTQLAPEVKNLRIPLEQILTQPFDLLAHRFEKRHGARQFFATGSDLSDSYTFYSGPVRRQVQFAWAESRPVTDFVGKSVYLDLNEGNLSVKTSDDVWFTGNLNPLSTEQYQFTFSNVLLFKEATNVTLGNLVGSGAQTELQVDDGASVSDVVHSTVKMRYYVKANAAYYQKWQGTVPPTSILSSENQLKVQLGKLNLDVKHLQPGLKVLAQVWVTRSMGTKSYTKSFEKYYTIGN